MATPQDAPTTQPADPAPPARAGGQGRTLLVGGGLALALLLVAAVALSSRGGDAIPETAVAVPSQAEDAPFGLTDAVAELPPATLEGFAGGPDLVISDLLGAEPLVINFWASWCGPCVAEMPDLQRLHEAGEGMIQLVGIDVRDAPPNAEAFAEEIGITYPMAVDPDEAYFRATGSFGMPTTLFVRSDGSVAYRQTGPLSLADMRALVAEHLGVDVPVGEG
jgi:thiol-disulfide isomerase/thioredoxin